MTFPAITVDAPKIHFQLQSTKTTDLMSISFCRSLTVILAFEFSVTKQQSITFLGINKNTKMMGKLHNKCPDHSTKRERKKISLFFFTFINLIKNANRSNYIF